MLFGHVLRYSMRHSVRPPFYLARSYVIRPGLMLLGQVLRYTARPQGLRCSARTDVIRQKIGCENLKKSYGLRLKNAIAIIHSPGI